MNEGGGRLPGPFDVDPFDDVEDKKPRNMCGQYGNFHSRRKFPLISTNFLFYSPLLTTSLGRILQMGNFSSHRQLVETKNLISEVF